MSIFKRNDHVLSERTSSKSTDKLIALTDIINKLQEKIVTDKYDTANIKLDWIYISGEVCPVLTIKLESKKDSTENQSIKLVGE
jgi:type IV secretory pathway ATPase VirB11/archaellum biosynthesis ATPase